MKVEQLYQHFRREEQPFIQQVANWIEQVEMQYAPVLTYYLDPRERYIMETMVSSTELKVQSYSALPCAERQRALLYPDYFVPEAEDFEEQIYQIDYAHQFGTIKHHQILGAIMHCGIRREVLGDIITDGVHYQFAVTESMGDYLAMQVTQIGRKTVHLKKIINNQILQPIDESQRESTTIASFRLDNVVANVYNIPRQHAKQLVQNGRVKVNFSPMNRSDFQLACDDIVSIRGYGRFRITKIGSKTRKDRYHIDFSVLRK